VASKIYLDTSVISALFDERTPERKLATEQSWLKLKDKNISDVYISELVLEELQKSAEPLRNRLLSAVSDFNVLPITENTKHLAGIYIKQGIFPEKYFDDALHVAVAALNEIGILLSWNFTHLVKLKTRRMVSLVNAMESVFPVEIASPPEI
jgi:predicted nucleic acid-binding protein